MKYLITGASGFLGEHLVARLMLKDGHRVATIAHDSVGGWAKEFVGDVRTFDDVKRAVAVYEPDVVVHLAAQSKVGAGRRDPLGTFETNVMGTANVLEAVRLFRPLAAVVVASSDKAYGSMKHWTYSEDYDPMDGVGPYDCSKSCADLVARSYAETYGMRVATIRAGNIYGPDDRGEGRVIPSFIDDLIEKRDVTVMSDGKPVRDYLYVDDCVEGYIKAVTWLQLNAESKYMAFNLAGGQPVSVEELARMMIFIWKRVVNDADLEETYAYDPKVNILGVRKDEIVRQILNTRRAKEVLGWEPRTTLEEGLARTIRSSLGLPPVLPE